MQAGTSDMRPENVRDALRPPDDPADLLGLKGGV